MEQCVTTSRGKTHGEKNGRPRIAPEILPFSHVCIISFDIAQDCSLGQCLTSSRAETSKKNYPKLGPNIPKSGLKWGFPAFSFLLY